MAASDELTNGRAPTGDQKMSESTQTKEEPERTVDEVQPPVAGQEALGEVEEPSEEEVSADPIAGAAAEAPALGDRVRTAFGRFDRWRRKVQEPWRDGESLVEIATAVVHDVERTLEPLGGGRKLFPFAGVAVKLVAGDVEQQSLYRAGLEQGWLGDLEQALLERLRAAGCDLGAVAIEGSVSGPDDVEAEDDAPEDHDVGWVVVPDTGGRCYELAFRPVVEGSRPRGAEARDEPGEPSAETGPRLVAVQDPAEEPVAAKTGSDASAVGSALRLVVEEGVAHEAEYRFVGQRVTLGRMVDVFDQHGRIRRRNDVAFLDEEALGDADPGSDGAVEINGTVSREHARIHYRAEGDDWWIVDDRSSYGTRLFRDGKAISVTSRDRRGVRLKQGDRIYLGRAVLRCGFD